MNVNISVKASDLLSVKVLHNSYHDAPFIAVWFGDLTLMLPHEGKTNTSAARKLAAALTAAADEADKKMEVKDGV